MKTVDVIVGAEASADGRTVWVSTPVHMYRGREGAEFTELPAAQRQRLCAARGGRPLWLRLELGPRVGPGAQLR